jgi:type II secretory pathway pseudopilin PulG
VADDSSSQNEHEACDGCRESDGKRDYHWYFEMTIAVVGIAAAIGAAFFAGKLFYITKDQERRQLRAYIEVQAPYINCLDCNQPNYAPPPPTPGSENKNTITIQIINGGQTPASDIQVHTNWWPTKFGVALPADFNWPDLDTSSSGNLKPIVSVSTLGRDQQSTIATPITTKNDIQIFSDVASHRGSAWVYGRVDYCDIFRRTHSKLFCFEFNAVPYQQFTVCDRHTDDQDTRQKCDK